MKKLILIVLILFFAMPAFGATLNLKATWPVSIETDIASYRLYRTDGSRTLIGGVNHPMNSLEFTVTVPDGTAGTLTFVWTATDKAGQESADSPPGSYSYNLIPPDLPPVAPGSAPVIEKVEVVPPPPPSFVKKGYGGLDALPPEWLTYENILVNGDWETGNTTGWIYPTNAEITTVDKHSGAYSFRGTGAGNFGIRQQNLIQSPAMAKTVSAWVKPDVGAAGTINFGIFDNTHGGGGGTIISKTVGTDLIAGEWTLITASPPIMYDFPMLLNANLELRISSANITGYWYIDDIQWNRVYSPLRTFVKSPNYRGYAWPENQTVTGVVKAHIPVGGTILSDYKAVIKFYKAEGELLNTQTISEFDANEEAPFSFDLSPYAPDDEILIKTELQDKASSTVKAIFPDWRVVKKSASHKAGLKRYIDNDNFLVVNGVKRFMLGVYDRFSSARCTGCRYLTQAEYETNINGFDGKKLMQNYAECKLDIVLQFYPMSAASPGFGPSSVWSNPATKDPAWNDMDPYCDALNAIGAGHLQIEQEYHARSGIRNYSFRAQAGLLTDEQMWEVITTYPSSPGFWGHYITDEPDLGTRMYLHEAWGIYETIRKNDPDGIAFIAMMRAPTAERWREAADIVSQDPYITPGLEGQDFWYGDTTRPYHGRVKTSLNYLSSIFYSSRPLWPVLQFFEFPANNFPTAADNKSQTWRAIVHGAHGIFWWGFVSVSGMEDRWYAHADYQAYYDFRDLTNSIKAIEPALIAPNENWRASCDNPNIEFIVKKLGNTYYLIASNSKEADQPNVSCTIDASIIGSVAVHSESRTLIPTGGTWTDNFLGYEAHVYVMET